MEDKLQTSQTRKVLYWLTALALCSLGCALCTKSDFGLSMIAAVSYILHYVLRDTLPWFTQGTSDYTVQAILLIVVCLIIRRFKPRYLLSFGTGVLSGLFLDFWFLLLGGNGAYTNLGLRITVFALGTVLSAVGIAFYFHTTLPSMVYELVVSEFSAVRHLDLNKVKLGNDILMLTFSLALSLVCTGTLHGIGIGTVIITFANAPLIALFGKIIDRF